MICISRRRAESFARETFVQWQETGLLERIFHDLGADADLQDISIDSTYIKAYKASAGAAKKGNAIPKTNSKTNASE